jgi:hypothetical protein
MPETPMGEDPVSKPPNPTLPILVDRTGATSRKRIQLIIEGEEQKGLGIRAVVQDEPNRKESARRSPYKNRRWRTELNQSIVLD